MRKREVKSTLMNLSTCPPDALASQPHTCKPGMSHTRAWPHMVVALSRLHTNRNACRQVSISWTHTTPTCDHKTSNHNQDDIEAVAMVPCARKSEKDSLSRYLVTICFSGSAEGRFIFAGIGSSGNRRAVNKRCDRALEINMFIDIELIHSKCRNCN